MLFLSEKEVLISRLILNEETQMTSGVIRCPTGKIAQEVGVY